MERESQGFYWSSEGFLVDDLFAPMRGSGPVYADRHLIVTRTESPEGLRFAGEIDVSNSSAVGQSVRAVLRDSGNPHLDVSNLSFCDISGIRALLEAATALGDGRRLLLHGLPEQLQTVMKITGWSNLSCMRLCGCEGGS